MTNMKKILGLSATGVAALMLLVACGGDKKAESGGVKLPDAKYQVDKKKPAWQTDKSKDNQLTWYINAEWWNKKYGTDLITKQVKKDLNLDIKFIVGDDTKLNTYFASGDIPDIVTVLDANSEVARTANKWALPLQDLANKYDPYFNEVARKETLNWYKLADGKTYGYPNYSNTMADFKSGAIPTHETFIIRQDVLDAIGPQDFTTPEGFQAGMRAIQAKYPDLTPFGFNDMAGGVGALEKVVQDMLGVPIKTKDDKFYDRQLDTDYMTWLKTFRQVHEEGHISDDSFTDNGDTFKEKVSSGKYATIMMGANVNLGNSMQSWLTANPDKAYVAIDGVMSTKGNKPTLQQAGLSGWMINYISQKTKNPAKAIQVFEYLLSEYGEVLTNFGIEGKTFNYIDGDKKSIAWTDEAAKMQSENPEKWQQEYRVGEFIQFGHDRFKSYNKASYVKAVLQQQEWGKKYLTPQFEIENIAPEPGTQEARALSAIETKWDTTLVSLIRAKNDAEFDKVLSDYKAFQKKNSIVKINQIRDKNIKKNMKKLSAN